MATTVIRSGGPGLGPGGADAGILAGADAGEDAAASIAALVSDAPTPRPTLVKTFWAMMAREFRVLRRNAVSTFTWAVMQPLLFVFVFAYVLPKSGGGMMVAGAGGGGYLGTSTFAAAWSTNVVLVTDRLCKPPKDTYITVTMPPAGR